MIKAVFFDIDNTVYNYTAAHKVAYRNLEEFCTGKYGITPERFHELYVEAMNVITDRIYIETAAIHNRLIRFCVMLEMLQGPGKTDLAGAIEMYHAYWDTLLEIIKPEPGLCELLEALKNKGIYLGVGTDMTAFMQLEKLKKLGILQYFSGIVSSEEAGVEKPHQHLFQLCADKAGCLPEECIFIGDHRKKDVGGAIAAGMHGIWYCPSGKKDRPTESQAFQDEMKNRAAGILDAGGEQEDFSYPVLYSFEDCLRGDHIQLGEYLL